MNRMKKEELLKHRDARRNLSPEQIDALNSQEADDRVVEKIARSIHYQRFPEEYDFYTDSYYDSKLRSNGINPMCDEYILETIQRRNKLGVSPLRNNGMPMINDTWELCLKEARQAFNIRKDVGYQH